MTQSSRDSWPAWLSLNGFVLRSLDIRGRTALDAERMCGFRFGLFADGVALYRLDDRVVQQFLNAPERNIHVLDLYVVGFNDERGPRDWDAMEIASYYGEPGYNGYSDERMRQNSAYFSPSAERTNREQTKQIQEIAAELYNLYSNGGFIGKLLFRSPRPKDRAPYETYPPGGGMREYQLLRRHSFMYVMSCSAHDVRKNLKLDW